MHCGGQVWGRLCPRRAGRRKGERWGGRKREAAQRPCPQLRTGYVKQPGRVCWPNLLSALPSNGGRGIGRVPCSPLNATFSPGHFRGPAIRPSINASHYVPRCPLPLLFARPIEKTPVPSIVGLRDIGMRSIHRGSEEIGS